MQTTLSGCCTRRDFEHAAWMLVFPSGVEPGYPSRSRARRPLMLFRPFLNENGSCASYLFGCTTHEKLAIVYPHADLVDQYLKAALAIGSPITAAFETPLQADHDSR